MPANARTQAARKPAPGLGSGASARRSVLIVEDHPLVRKGFRELLSGEPDLKVCGEAADSEQALRLFRSTAPELILVDISLPGGSGLELVEALCNLDPDAKVLVVSVHDDPLYAERSLGAGALGYVNKQEEEEVFLHAVRSVLNGNAYVSPAVYRRWPETSLLGTRGQDRTWPHTLRDG